MTTKQALLYALSSQYDRVKCIEAERALISAGLCPQCAYSGRRVRLDPWEPGDAENHAGRICPSCEEFVACGDQYSDPGPETDACGQCYSDADPGL